MKHILEMKYPSSWWHDLWREGLPIGNGFTGGNLYGGAKKETLQLNRHDFWYRGKEEPVPDVGDALSVMRHKMDAGNFEEASWEIVNVLKEKGYNSTLESQIPLASLTVEQNPIKGFQGFVRRLHMEQAVASQEWTDDCFRMRREAFVSRAEDMVVYRLTAHDGKGNTGENVGENTSKKPQTGEFLDKLQYKLRLQAYRNEGQKPIPEIEEIWDAAHTEVKCVDEHTAYLYFASVRKEKGSIPGDFGAVAKVCLNRGRLKVFQDTLKVFGADEVLVTIKLYVNENTEKAWKRLQDDLAQQSKSYEELLEESATLHSKLYHSAELTIYDADEWSRCNEDLVMEAFSERQSKELIEKLWHFGRYLFICGTNSQANPFPLYGLWGGGYRLQWCHNMANENMQMIYWHSLCGNLVEYNESVFRYINDRIPAFTENGRKLFGIDGIYMTAGTTPGVSSPTQVVPVIINWVGAAGWLAQHYYHYFMYTGDMEYAEKIMLPYFDGVARFYEEFAGFSVDENGRERIKWYPSVSPENTPVNFMPPQGVSKPHPMPTTINATIDLAILKEFFANLLDLQEKCTCFTFEESRVHMWRRIINAIPEYAVNSEGAIKEWQEEIFEDRYDHRHLSHIYPVFPGCEFYPKTHPQEMQAYERAVELRKIDAQTGWSMAHMAAIYARFRRGDRAMECLDNMAKSSLLNNFFTLHNDWRGMNISLNMDPAPVQLDAIMGYVNAIQEMLLYAAPGYIALLPALEERLYQGKVENFRYSDGYVAMEWDVAKKNFVCKITPVRPHKLRISLPEFVETVEWKGLSTNMVQQLSDFMWEVIMDDRDLCIKTLS